MKNITTTILALSLTLGLLTGCATDPHPMDMSQMLQNAKTPADHEALAQHYEQAAQDMQAKVAEHKVLLEQYKAHLYGKQMQGMQTHCQYLLSMYEKIADENMKMAEAHRQMAGNAQ